MSSLHPAPTNDLLVALFGKVRRWGFAGGGESLEIGSEVTEPGHRLLPVLSLVLDGCAEKG